MTFFRWNKRTVIRREVEETDIKMKEKLITKYIYGAGKYGRTLLKHFRTMGDEIDFFVQTEISTETYVDGIQVKSIADIEDNGENHVFFIAIADERASKAAKMHILTLNLADARIYNYGRFIEDNLLNIGGKTTALKECFMCGKTFSNFRPFGIEKEIFCRHHIIGGGYRENALCPYCGSLDRERWLSYVLFNKLKVLNNGGRILHFAPEKHIYSLIRENKNIDYYTGDIEPGSAMHVTDITNIQYKDCVFDYVISNHVMEHIVNEEKAVSEVIRVLKPDGKWIFSFPICMEFKTYEDDSIVTEEQRLKTYGQKDHVRLYGNDFKEHFEKYGLKLEIYSPKDVLSPEVIERWGLIADDVIICAGKRLD